jgi:ribosomal protein S18 acetylase RimI-like enzyme
VSLALELFDETFPASLAEPAAVATAEREGTVADYEFIGSFNTSATLLGYACFGATPSANGTYDLYWIAVDPDHHGLGAGSQLLEAVEQRLGARDGRLIVVETSTRPDYANTRRFYEHRGYRPSARIADFYAPGDDRLILTKRLSRPHHPHPRSPQSGPSPAVPRPNPEFTRHE